MRTQIRKREEWTPTKDFLPLILGKEFGKELEDHEIEKLNLFEKGLAAELAKDDTIEQAVTKIVKMALAAEFGPSLVAAKGAKGMIDTISRSILTNPELRKQALIILDRFAHE
ncbi:MAG: hypothetical protein PHH60_05735 [Candidatus Margulisbacteria bacterium]|nr:hypothetical protein [Candidatus Margulisiibacteriota bacterium]